MTAVTWENVERDDPSYREISPKAIIHPSVRIEPFCVIEDNVMIGADTIIGPFNQIRSNSVIGKGCRIGGHNTFEGSLTIGKYVRMGTHCNIGWNCGVADYVFIAGKFTGGNDKRMIWKRSDVFVPDGYHIMMGARIGLDVTILPGVVVGQEAMIGAGSLVTKSVPAFEEWYGHPARKQGEVPQSERLKFQD